MYDSNDDEQISMIHWFRSSNRACALVLGLLPGPADGLDQVRFGDLLAAREVPRSNLCVDLDARVGREEVLYRYTTISLSTRAAHGRTLHVPGIS